MFLTRLLQNSPDNISAPGIEKHQYTERVEVSLQIKHLNLVSALG